MRRASAWTPSVPSGRTFRPSASAWGTRASGMYTAVRWFGPGRSCTEKLRSCTMPASAFFADCPSPSRPPATIPWWWSGLHCPTAWRSPPGPSATAPPERRPKWMRSWGCGTGIFPSRGCSSIRNPFSPPRATTCCATFSPETTMDVRTALARLAERGDLTQAEARAVFSEVMAGEATPAQIGGLLMGLRTKGEVAEEIAGAAEAMRALSLRVDVDAPHLVDTCGTGGSGEVKLFNVSTAAAFVAAAAGAHVAKHGNRKMTSASGSADVLEAAGVNLALTPAQIAECIREVGVGFLFAQAHH